jgi:hypothetical protein
MNTNRLNLRNVVAVAICLVAMTIFASCEKGDNQAEKSLVGKWVTSNNHAGDNNTIVFKENFCAEQYFDYILVNQEYPAFMTYSLSENKISFQVAFSYLPPEILEILMVTETFEYTLKGNSLTIKKFSNPFSSTFEKKRDVHFKRIK